MRRGGRTLRLALAAVVFALLVFTFRDYVSESGSSSSLYAATPWAWIPEMQNHVSSSRQGCGGLKGLERVVITVKTGATEALQKIPVQMRTSLRCAPHVLVFSDMAQTIGDIEVHDVLNETADEIKDGNRDFEIYRKQQELKDPQKIISQLKSFKTPGTKESASWRLDKYKNMHLVEKAWAMKPNMDWYLHIDADTYVMLPSLAEWIKRLDPNKHMYLGRRIATGNVFFGHGGSGILLSGEAMRVFAVDNAGTAARWDPKANTSCCGDILLSRALSEVGIPSVLHAWPSINGESPSTMPFGDQQWCEPIVTMHHVTVDEMETVAKFEINRRHMNKPVTFEEFYKGVPIGDYPERKKHWDNLAQDDWDDTVPDYRPPGKILHGIESADECYGLCTDDETCFQARFDGWDECALLTTGFVVGNEKMPEWPKRWDSFWNITRIENWVAKQPACPSKVTFRQQLDKY